MEITSAAFCTRLSFHFLEACLPRFELETDRINRVIWSRGAGKSSRTQNTIIPGDEWPKAQPFVGPIRLL
jgi:hypothetical protein